MGFQWEEELPGPGSLAQAAWGLLPRLCLSIVAWTLPGDICMRCFASTMDFQWVLVVALPSLFRRSSVALPSIFRRSSVALPSLFRRSSVALPSPAGIHLRERPRSLGLASERRRKRRRYQTGSRVDQTGYKVDDTGSSFDQTP